VQPEARFARVVDEFLDKLPESYWFTIQQRNLRGHPDKIGVVRGTFCALELKRSRSARKAPMQDYILSRIRDSGGFAEFCFPENWENVRSDLRAIAIGGFDWTRYKAKKQPS
jgi:hypothetical protein